MEIGNNVPLVIVIETKNKGVSGGLWRLDDCEPVPFHSFRELVKAVTEMSTEEHFKERPPDILPYKGRYFFLVTVKYHRNNSIQGVLSWKEGNTGRLNAFFKNSCELEQLLRKAAYNRVVDQNPL